jgi:hypothetical protein
MLHKHTQNDKTLFDSNLLFATTKNPHRCQWWQSQDEHWLLFAFDVDDLPYSLVITRCSAFILLTDKMFTTFSAHCLAPTGKWQLHKATIQYSWLYVQCCELHKAVANFSIFSSLQKIGTIEIPTSPLKGLQTSHFIIAVRYVCKKMEIRGILLRAFFHVLIWFSKNKKRLPLHNTTATVSWTLVRFRLFPIYYSLR